MSLPVYNLFTEDARGNPVWLDALADLESARKRLLKLASVDPGDYFIFDLRSQQVVTSLISVREDPPSAIAMMFRRLFHELASFRHRKKRP
jgi:hypothetical protein